MFEYSTGTLKINNTLDDLANSLRIIYMQVMCDEDRSNETTTQKVRMWYFLKTAAGAKYAAFAPGLQAITCSDIKFVDHNGAYTNYSRRTA